MTIVLQEFFGGRATHPGVIIFALDLTRYLDRRYGPWLRTAILLVAIAEEPQRTVAKYFGLPELWLAGYVQEFQRRLLQ